MEAFGRQLGQAITSRGEVRCLPAMVVYLHGDLGAGKTTLARGIIQGMGYAGEVTSPTYTLVEQYDTTAGTVCHFDLYRLEQSSELEFLGIRDILGQAAVCLFEWPCKGGSHIPAADIEVNIEHTQAGRSVTLPSTWLSRPGRKGELGRHQSGGTH